MGDADNRLAGDDQRFWSDDESKAPAREAETTQFAFGGREEQLPWLDSGEDDREQGVDTGRLVGFALVIFAALGLGLGGFWWFNRDASDSALVADGSTIAAPEGPIKTRPDDPGGRTFEGTGDSSFAVGEGQSREGVLASESAPASTMDPVAGAGAPTSAPAPLPAPSGVGVQVGAYSSRAAAEQGWSELVRRHSALQGVPHRVIEGDADIGKVFRLQAVASGRSAADSLCGRIRAGGGSCQVKP